MFATTQNVRWDWPEWTAIILVLLATILCYTNSLGGQFVSDDHQFVRLNEEIRSLQPFHKFFTSARAFSAYGDFAIYRPLSSLSYALELKFHGPQPYGFHVTNVLLHAACSVTVFVVMRMMLGSPLSAALATLLFTVHPGNTESVTWIAQRSGLLSAVFFLGAFALHLRALRRPLRNTVTLIGVVILYALSLLGKEMGITLPLVILLHDWLLVPKQRRLPRKRAWWYYGTMVGAAILYLALRTSVLGYVSQRGWHGGTFLNNVLMVIGSVGFYARLAVWPVNLSAHYPTWIPQGLLDWPVLTGLLALMILALLAGMFRRLEPRITFGIAWFLVTLLPALNLVPIRTMFNDRFLYVPLVGLCLVAGCMVLWLVKSVSAPWKWGTVAVAVLVIAAGAWGTIRRNPDWRSRESLATSILRLDPTDGFALYQMGVVWEERARLAQEENRTDEAGLAWTRAEEYWLEGVKHQSNNVPAAFSLGRMYQEKKDYDKAVEVMESAAKAAEESNETVRDLLWTYHDLGKIYLMRGDVEPAKDVYRRAIERFPKAPAAYVELVKLLRITDPTERQESIKVMLVAHGHWPADVRLTRKLAGVLLEEGRVGQALGVLVATRNAMSDRDPERAVLESQIIDVTEKVKQVMRRQEQK